LRRREQQQGHALGIAGFEGTAVLAFSDQVHEDRECACGGPAQRGRLPALPAGEHDLNQRGVARREPDVRPARGTEAHLVVLTGALRRSASLRAEAFPAGRGERVQQGLTVGEVTPRRRVADADLACALTET
jgi:hypothetical protein